MTPPEDVRMFARSEGIVSVSGLAQRHVLLLGAGSVGSFCADHLVRAGVGSLTVVDPDQVSLENTGRSLYLPAHVGRQKVDVIQEHVLAIRSRLAVDVHACRLQDATDLRGLVARAHLVVSAIDDPAAQKTLTHIAYQAGIPCVFIALYARAAGGEVILSVPNRSPCYVCHTGTRTQLEIPGTARATNYGTGRLEAEPGLAADIHHVASAGVKLALSLLSGSDEGAPVKALAEEALRRGMSFLTVSTEPRYWFFPHIFGETAGQHGFQSVWLTPEKQPTCAICGEDEYRVPWGPLASVSLSDLRREYEAGVGRREF